MHRVVLTSGIQRSAVEQYAVDGVELKVENCGVVLSQLGNGIEFGVESTRSTSGNLLQTRKGTVLNKDSLPIRILLGIIFFMFWRLYIEEGTAD